MEENVGRLYNLEMEKQKVKMARLRKKYNCMWVEIWLRFWG